MTIPFPILYSFRRCPYAIRARLAIVSSGISVELREVVLRNKPEKLLLISPKGTVPVLQLADATVIDESLDIMLWALYQNDPDHWLDDKVVEDGIQLIQSNDGTFKYYLDRYKYADRYPQQSAVFYRTKAEQFLKDLEIRLGAHSFLCSQQYSVADRAIFPFIRQFAQVDKNWFQNSVYQKLNEWLQKQIESELFIAIMKKYPAWDESGEVDQQIL